jgi:hypothetical protein
MLFNNTISPINKFVYSSVFLNCPPENTGVFVVNFVGQKTRCNDQHEKKRSTMFFTLITDNLVIIVCIRVWVKIEMRCTNFKQM